MVAELHLELGYSLQATGRRLKVHTHADRSAKFGRALVSPLLRIRKPSRRPSSLHSRFLAPVPQVAAGVGALLHVSGSAALPLVAIA